MKHWLHVWLVLLTVFALLCGCGAQRETLDPVTEGFSCRAAITYGEMEVDARLACTPEGKMTISFLLPKSLSGVTFGWDGAAGAFSMVDPKNNLSMVYFQHMVGWSLRIQAEMRNALYACLD